MLNRNPADSEMSLFPSPVPRSDWQTEKKVSGPWTYLEQAILQKAMVIVMTSCGSLSIPRLITSILGGSSTSFFYKPEFLSPKLISLKARVSLAISCAWTGNLCHGYMLLPNYFRMQLKWNCSPTHSTFVLAAVQCLLQYLFCKPITSEFMSTYFERRARFTTEQTDL